MKFKKYFTGIIIIIIFVAVGLTYNYIQGFKSNKMSQYPKDSIGLDFKNLNGTEANLNANIINNEIEGNITVINTTKYNGNFTLTAFIDYNQVPISVNNKSSDKFIFNLDKQNEKTFKVKLTANNISSLHKLNFILYNNSKVAHADKDYIIFEPLVTKTNLISTDTNKSKIPNISFNDKINTKDLEVFKLNGQDSNNNKDINIQVKADEQVIMPLDVASFENGNDYIFWMTLDSNQIYINNNQKYWYFNLPKGFGINKNVIFKAPHKKGTYQLIGFLSINPWIEKDDSKNYNRIINSPKINLIVN